MVVTAGSILTLNAGSSSLKFAIFGPGQDAALRGEVEDHQRGQHLIARDAGGTVLIERELAAGARGGPEAALHAVLALASEHVGPAGLAAVGHRIVHGGLDHVAPTLVTPALLASLDALTTLDPLHMPLNLAPLRIIADAHPGLPQVACFDTAFHRTMPPVAQAFALPRELHAAGIRRYGFHGLSFEFIAGRLATLAPGLARGRVIVAHLGSGASLCALRGGVSIATTMGFTSLDGLMMATRCGSLDAGVVLYLAGLGHSQDDIRDMLYHRSGLLGVSGISGDLRILSANGGEHAREAIDLFVHRLVCETGAMVAALEGLDALVFTAGIGEHDAGIRAATCARLAWLGVRLDTRANEADATWISTPDSAVDVLVVPTDEEAVIARHTREIVGDLDDRPEGHGRGADTRADVRSLGVAARSRE